MKKSVVGLILLALLLQTCRDDEPVNTGNVQFAFSASSPISGGGRSLSDLTDGAILIISISKSNGDPVHTLKELPLLKLGDQFISSPLALPYGNYTITDLLIENADHEVLYATPKEGSPLASLVEHPLPIAFSIAENEITNLDVEVVAIGAHQPGEFGYVSFSIDIVLNPLFRLSVFTPDENGTFEFSGAQAYILHDDDTIFDQYLLPSVNTILFEGNLTDSYTLVLLEPSYKKYSRTFTLDEIENETRDNDFPLTVLLTPAFTFTIEGISYVEFELAPRGQSTSATVNVDWGDGVIEEIPFDYNDPYLKHTYVMPGNYFVSASGDLDVMESVNLSYSYITDVSLRYLPELKDFALSAAHTPPTVDFSHNKKLEFVNFLIVRTITSLDISNNTSLKVLMLLCSNDFTVESLDMVIHNLLRNARDYGVTDGVVTIQMCNESGANEEVFIGPPSPAAMEELRELRDTYGWLIYPQVDF